MAWIRAQFTQPDNPAAGWTRLGRALVLILVAQSAALYAIAASAHVQASPRVAAPRNDESIDCAGLAADKPLVLLVLGQSNAANHGGEPVTHVRDPAASVALIHNGRCYRASDPLPGGTGSRESIWTRLPDAWQALGQNRPLAFSLVGVDSTAIQRWVEDGELIARAADQLAGLRRQGLEPDAVIWLQGEADARDATTEATYSALFEQLMARLQDQGLRAPIIVARASRCGRHYSEEVRRAQQSLADRHANVMAGPDLDQLGAAWRRDGCHFSSAGLQEAARLWAQSLTTHTAVIR